MGIEESAESSSAGGAVPAAPPAVVIERTKHCAKCNLVKVVSEFAKRGDRPGGLASYCKKCVNVYKRPKRESWEVPSEKECSRCREVKMIDEFAVNRRGKDGHASWCKRCQSDWKVDYWASKVKPDLVVENRLCAVCGEQFVWTSARPTRIYCTKRCFERSKLVGFDSEIRMRKCPACNEMRSFLEFGHKKRACVRCQPPEKEPRERAFQVIDGVATKRCTTCGERKLAEAFYKASNLPEGIGYYCRKCVNKYRARYRVGGTHEEIGRRNRDHYYASSFLRVRYGIENEEYDEMLRLQSGLCSICGIAKSQGGGKVRDLAKRPLDVDHDEELQKVRGVDKRNIRGLLCAHCNMAIGLLGHDFERLEAAIAYLKSPPSPFFDKD